MMPGRWSPINSPARNGKAKSQHSPRSGSKSVLSYDDDCDDDAPPPSYNEQTDGKSTPSRESRASNAYSNLLNFLDDATASANLPGGHVDVRDDISTISNSMGSPHRQRAFGTKKYVWDDIPQDIASVASAQESDTLTYFKAPTCITDNHTVGSTSTLQTSIEEVKSKVDAMKAELKTRQQQAKGMQSELARLQAAASEWMGGGERRDDVLAICVVILLTVFDLCLSVYQSIYLGVCCREKRR